MALDTNYVKMVINCKTSYEIWSRLSQIHEQKSTANSVMLQKNFYDLQMKPNEKVEDYIGRVEFMAGQLRRGWI